jgi:hypothetical protein
MAGNQLKHYKNPPQCRNAGGGQKGDFTWGKACRWHCGR